MARGLQPFDQWGRRAEDPFKGIEGWAGSHFPLITSADGGPEFFRPSPPTTKKYPNPAEVWVRRLTVAQEARARFLGQTSPRNDKFALPE